MPKYYTIKEISNMLEMPEVKVSIWIESGQLESTQSTDGSRVVDQKILLNYLRANKKSIPAELEKSGKPKLLIVEDDEDVIDFSTEVVKHLPYKVKVQIATTGYTAGIKVVKFKPDIVILDIMLPGINGFEVCGLIRQELGKDVKVLAVTGYYSDENWKKIMAAGADQFLPKPIILNDLEKILVEFLDSFKDKYNLIEKPGFNEEDR